MMTESEYQDLAKIAFRRLEAALGDLDPDAVDCDWAADVMTLGFPGGKKCVLNTQRPTRQIWVAANARAWHFSWDGTRWVDDKGHGDELFATVAKIVRDLGGIEVRFA